MRFLIRVAATAAALWLATVIVDGIDVSGSGPVSNALTLVAVAVVFGLVNACIKPLVKTVTGCLYVITLGLIALVVNALLFLLTEWIAHALQLPFHVDGFWPAFWGAIVVGIVSWLITLVVPGAKRDD